MVHLAIHHVSIVVSDLERSIAFYQRLFDLPRLQRPPFSTEGAWLGCGDLQLHLIVHPGGGSPRESPRIDTADWHFSFRTDDFEGVVERLLQNGFREVAAPDDPMRLLLQRQSHAGFPQLYVCDPDHNIVEVNGAPREQTPLWQDPVLEP